MDSVKLVDICRIEKGQQIDTSRLNDAHRYRYINGGVKESGYYDSFNSNEECVLVSEGGASCGYVNYINEPFWCGCHCYRLFDLKVMPKYLYYALKANQERIMDLRTGVCMPNIKKKEFQNFVVSIDRDAKRQDAVVKALDTIQKAIDLKRKQLEDLDELVKSKFQEMYGDVMLPESKWEQTTFGKAFDICSGGTPSTSKKEYWEDGTIPWIGSNMCQDWIIYHNDGKFITQEGLTHSSAKLLEPGTVLVALVGATIGKTALLRFRTTTNQNVAAIKVNDNTDYYPEFVFYLLQGLYGKFMNYSNGKFAMATLSFVRDLPLIKPQKSLQGEFVDYVEKVISLKGLCEREIVELNELMDSKMDEYFG